MQETPFKNIMVCAVKSERAVKASKLAATLFPNAVFHLVAVVPRLHSRVMLTTLYKETLEKIAHDALHEIEMAVNEQKVLAVRKVVLHGKPEKELVNYVKGKRIDLVVITSGITEGTPPRLVGPVTKKVLASVPQPVLVYPPAARGPAGAVRRAVLLVEKGRVRNEGKLIEVVKYLSGRSLEFVTLVCKEGDTLCERVREVIASAGLSHDVVSLRSENEVLGKALELAEEADLMVAGKGGKPHLLKPMRGSDLTRYQHTVAGLSSSPVILV